MIYENLLCDSELKFYHPLHGWTGIDKVGDTVPGMNGKSHPQITRMDAAICAIFCPNARRAQVDRRTVAQSAPAMEGLPDFSSPNPSNTIL